MRPAAFRPSRRRPAASAPSRRGIALRALFGSGALLLRRRARRDLVLLVCWMTLLASVAVLTLAVPRLALDTVDQGAREAVAAAGPRADVVVHAPIGQSSATLRLGTPEEAIALARKLPSRLPAALSAVLSSATLSLVSPELRLQPQADATASIPGKLAMLTPDSTRGLTVVSGRLPGAAGSDQAGPEAVGPDAADAAAAGAAVPGAGPKLVDIEVAVTSVAARAASIDVGSILEAPPIFEAPGAAPSIVTRFIVVGIVTPSPGASASARLRDLPLAWTPADARGTQPGPRAPGVTLLATPAGVAHAERLFVDPLEANVRLRLDPDAFTSGLEAGVADEIGVIQANSASLAGGSEIPLQVSSEFAEALAGYPLQARAAVAQMSLMIAGVLGVAAAVILLLSRLLVLRRADEIALERARGASLASVTLRVTVESLLTAAIGGGVGVAVASQVLPGATWDVTPLLAVGAIAVLAPPAQTLLVARSVWRGRREPANRRERAEIVRRGRARRLVVELGLLVLAAGALFSVRNRGLLQTRTDGVDPLLAAAPLLLATVVALVVLRVYPWVVRAVAVMVRRSRGTLGILGAAQAQRSLGALPLLALTLAVALAVSGGLLLDTVRSGQDAAAWQRVGADVRVEAPVTEADAARVGGSPGVDAAGAMLVQRGTEITDGPAFAIATLLAVDRGYADVLERLPRAPDGPGAVDGAADGAASTAARGLRALAAASAPSDPLPVVVDSELAEQLVSDTFTIRFREQNLRVRLVGIVDAGPVGYLSSPFLYVDLASLAERVPRGVTAGELLVMGPGAEQAVAALDVPRRDILSRTSWLDARQHLALVAGVGRMMAVSAGAAALFAIIALIATVLAGARRRARSLSLLRTLGVRSRMAWWLALSEAAPVVVAALVGGIVAGAGIVLVSGPALGLAVLAGGVGEPVLLVSSAVILGVAAGAVAVLAMAIVAAVTAHRRDRLSEVLRVGETG